MANKNKSSKRGKNPEREALRKIAKQQGKTRKAWRRSAQVKREFKVEE